MIESSGGGHHCYHPALFLPLPSSALPVHLKEETATVGVTARQLRVASSGHWGLTLLPYGILMTPAITSYHQRWPLRTLNAYYLAMLFI